MSTPYSVEELVAMADEQMAPISPEGIKARDEYLELSKQIKVLEAKRKKHADFLQKEAESKGALLLVDHEISMFEIVGCVRTSLDKAALEVDYPEIVEKYTISKPYTRVDVKK